MRLLDRFLLRELAIPLAYCLVGFLLFWISFNLFSELGEFQEKHLLARDVAKLYWVRAPEFLVIVLPVSYLLALLYALANHARHHEITAIRAAGISLWRICVPYFAVGIVLSLMLFWLTEKFGPTAAETRRQIMSSRITEDASVRLIQGLNFRNAHDNRIWHIRIYDPDTFEMTDPQIQWTLPDGSRRTTIARSAFRTNNVWVFSNVHVFVYPAGALTNPTEFQTNRIAIPEFTETPNDIRVQVKFSRLTAMQAAKRPRFSLAEIEYLETHIDLSRDQRAMLETQKQAALAQPWTCLVVALIAIPFGAASGRRNVFIGVAASIFIFFAYFFIQPIGLALSNARYLPPMVGAWLPNALFGFTGLWLTHRVK